MPSRVRLVTPFPTVRHPTLINLNKYAHLFKSLKYTKGSFKVTDPFHSEKPAYSQEGNS